MSYIHSQQELWDMNVYCSVTSFIYYILELKRPLIYNIIICVHRKKLYTISVDLYKYMSLLSKAEIQFLQGQKTISKSYEYKLKSIIKKKLSILVDKELPLLSSLLPNLHLTKISKINENSQYRSLHTKSGKIGRNQYSSLKHSLFCKNFNNSNDNLEKTSNRNSPAQIRTGVKGSKGLYAWPLHSALVILPGFRAFLYCKYGRY